MNVRVRLGAGLAPAAGNPRLVVALADNATVADLLTYLRAQYPTMKLDVAVTMAAGQHVASTDRLAEGQEIALLLPAAGGIA